MGVPCTIDELTAAGGEDPARLLDQDPTRTKKPRQLEASGFSTRSGPSVAASSEALFDDKAGAQLRGTFAGDKCTFAWCVGPEEPTSDEDSDGVVKPKRGEGRWGRGSPMTVHHNGAPRPYVDGAGLCSPSSWAPEGRTVDPIAMQLHEALVGLLRDHFGDLLVLAFRLACGRFSECPFSRAAPSRRAPPGHSDRQPQRQ